MPNDKITDLKQVFITRLDTLQHLLDCGKSHAGEHAESLLQERIAADMHPLGTQVAFACNQPRHFAQWCAGEDVGNLDPSVTSLGQAAAIIEATKKQVQSISTSDAKLEQKKKIELGGGLSVTLVGHSYVSEFLLPNFYFHLVTAYDILRMSGVPIGKRDFMLHVVPFITAEA